MPNTPAAIGVGPPAAGGALLELSDDAVGSGLNLEGARASAGPKLVIGTPIITAGAAAVVALDRSGACPALLLSDAVVGQSAELPRHAAFPVVIERLCRLLANENSAPAIISADRAAADPLWTGPPNAPASDTLTVADRPQPNDAVAAAATAPAGRWRRNVSDALLAGAAVLLAVESLLWARKKIA